MMRHERIHTGDNPFSCSYCGNKCNQSTRMMLHERIHIGDNPLAAPIVTTNVTNQPAWWDMKEYTTGITLTSCSYCDNKCNQSTHMIRHERIHTGDNPYNCSKTHLTNQPVWRPLHALQFMHENDKMLPCCNVVGFAWFIVLIQT